MRECWEETGLDVSFVGPFDERGRPRADPCRRPRGGRGHTHLDLRYLFDAGRRRRRGRSRPAGRGEPGDRLVRLGCGDRPRRPRPPRRPHRTPPLTERLAMSRLATVSRETRSRRDCGLASVERVFDTGWVGFNNPSWSWNELEAALSDRPAGARPGAMDGRRGARRGTPVATVRPGAASGNRSRRRRPEPIGRRWTAAGHGAVRRAALPFELLVPRRCVAPRGAGHRSGPARARGAGDHRPQRLLRGRPLRRGGQGGRPPDRVRRRDHCLRWSCSLRSHSVRIGPRRLVLRPSVGSVARSEADTIAQVNTGLVPDSHAPDPHGTHLLAIADGPDGYARLSRALSVGHLAGEKGAPQFAFDDLADGARRPRLGAHRLSQGCGPGGVGGRRAGCGAS